MMKKKNIIIICIGLMLLSSFASAAIVFDGNVSPATPAEWNSTTLGYIGSRNTGTVTMTESTDSLAALGLYVGNYNNSVGTLNMSGGSTLTLATTNGLVVANGTSTNTTGKGYVYLDGAGPKFTAGSTGTSIIGRYGTGFVSVKNGAQLATGLLNMASGETNIVGSGKLVVEGTGSKVTSTTIALGHRGATGAPVRSWLDILDGGKVEVSGGTGTYGTFIGYTGNTNSIVTVDGVGSTLSTDNLEVGRYDRGRLVITHDGLVKVSGLLCMNIYGTVDEADICMASYGKLALNGDGSADLDAFFALMGIPAFDSTGTMTNVIKYDPDGTWTDIHSAIRDVDYTLEYITSGDLTGYTVLTVIPVSCEYDVKGDFNNDCEVNFEDFAVIAGNWLVDCIYPVVDPRCSE
jgi:T5SS/PEP-CTERM-associated repeat protein